MLPHHHLFCDHHVSLIVSLIVSFIVSLIVTVGIQLDCKCDCQCCSNLQALKVGGGTVLPPAPSPPPPPLESRPPRRRGAADDAAHRVPNAVPFGRWSISRIVSHATGRTLVGIGANCHAKHHKDPLRPKLLCKKFVTITSTVDENRARWLAKLWLLEGCDPLIQDRDGHVMDVKVHEIDFYKYGPTEADLDAEAARR